MFIVQALWSAQGCMGIHILLTEGFERSEVHSEAQKRPHFFLTRGPMKGVSALNETSKFRAHSTKQAVFT